MIGNTRNPVISMEIGAFRTVSKNIEKCREEWEIRGRIETNQNSALLRLGRILRRVLET